MAIVLVVDTSKQEPEKNHEGVTRGLWPWPFGLVTRRVIGGGAGAGAGRCR